MFGVRPLCNRADRSFRALAWELWWMLVCVVCDQRACIRVAMRWLLFKWHALSQLCENVCVCVCAYLFCPCLFTVILSFCAWLICRGATLVSISAHIFSVVVTPSYIRLHDCWNLVWYSIDVNRIRNNSPEIGLKLIYRISNTTKPWKVRVIRAYSGVRCRRTLFRVTIGLIIAIPSRKCLALW